MKKPEIIGAQENRLISQSDFTHDTVSTPFNEVQFEILLHLCLCVKEKRQNVFPNLLAVLPIADKNPPPAAGYGLTEFHQPTRTPTPATPTLN